MRGGLKAVWGTTAMALVLGAMATPALAEEDSGDGEQVTVTATRSDATVDSVPSVVTVIDADDIEENLATDIKDLIRFEPGVSGRFVVGKHSRFLRWSPPLDCAHLSRRAIYL